MFSPNSAEAEYVASSNWKNQIIWLKRFILEFLKSETSSTNLKWTTTDIYTDGSAAISLTEKIQDSEHTKHIEIIMRPIREW